MFSRLLGLNTWLQRTCSTKGVNFIDNFNIFWGHRQLFKLDGLHPNKLGARVLKDHFYFSLRHPSVVCANPLIHSPGQNMSDHRTSYQLPSHYVVEESHKDTDNATQPKQALLMDIPAEPCPQSSSHADCDVSQQLQDSAPKDDFLENSLGSQDNTSQSPETPELEPRSPDTISLSPAPGQNMPRTPDTLSLSPASPLLSFSQKMEELVYAGTKLSASPQISTKKRRTPQPPKTAGSALPPPPVRALRPLPQRKGPNPSNLRPVMHQSKIAVETKCNSIKLAFLNTRSLKNKSFVINDLITTNNLDFMFLIETWLEDNCSATVLTETAPPNFNFISVCRTVRRGGGVAALFKDVYQCKQVSFGQYLSFEYLGIVLKGAPRILFIIIYRPPKYSPAFVEEFTELLSMISSEFDCFAIAGDFNIHIDNAEIKTTKEIVTVLNTFDLIQHVHGPTHNRGHTLDLLISRGLNISSIVIKDVAMSDHFCIFFDILISVTTESRSVSVRKRCINENTSVLFMKAISLTPSISADSVDLLLDSFDSKVKNVIDDIAPIKVSKKNGRQKSFWRKSTAVQNMKRQCRKAERMWRKTKLEIHYSIYKDSLHAFNLELATARQTFFSNLINSNLNNTRTIFATVERLTNPPSQIPSEMLSDSKCNEFASFFSEKISNIRKEIGTSSCNTEVTQIRQQSQKEVTMSVFKTIDSKILEEIVQHLKSSTCYLDTLPTSFFKSVLNCLEADLLEVVNTSLLSGTFPNSLKTAVVKPLLKKRNLDNTVLSNYRPISNLPFIGKIIEKVVFNQLNNYLNSNGYLDNFQSGFRVHHSTETALIKIINDIRFNSDSGKISVLVLLDLSAAFDTVDHNILLERLENWVGLSGMALKWFRSYLEGRGYYVSIGEHKSKWTSMTCGVPQGSILAPLLFSLYMLPLSQIMRKNQIAYHSYADDTQIYLALSPNDYSPIDSLCQCIDEINSWMCQNFLQLNKEKTVIAFGNKDEVLKVNAYLDSRGQTTKNQVRNLGVILETDLSFSSHVKAVTKSAYYHLKNIARIRCFVSSQDLEKLVHAFITSRVDYCNGLLTGLPKKTIRQLQLIQNAAARILTITRKSEHITPVLRSLHWLPVTFRIDFKVLLLVYKSLNGIGPKYMADMLTEYKPNRPLRSLGSSQLEIPRVHTNQGESAFSYYAARSWNQLPEEIKCAKTLATFKSRLKTHLFSCAFVE